MGLLAIAREYITTMGIPHLRRHLEPYAQRSRLQDCDIAIDGPALAYHILALCRKTTAKTPFEHPSYALLGQTAIAWLDQVQACGPRM